ncbi:hypothetical protein Tco_1530688 [Tanacetum coccineum]
MGRGASDWRSGTCVRWMTEIGLPVSKKKKEDFADMNGMDWLAYPELSSIVIERLSVYLFRMARFLKFMAKRPRKGSFVHFACIKSDEKKLD